MNATAKSRLNRLADGIEKYAKNEWFDMSIWGQVGFKEKECGTTACAAGWATTLMPRIGLKLTVSDAGEYDVGENDVCEIIYDGPKGKFVSIIACAAAFDIDINTAEYLFTNNTRLSRMQAVKRIRKVAQTGLRDRGHKVRNFSPEGWWR